MTKYHLGSDKSGSGDEECLQEIKSALEAANHDVNYLRIDPDLEGDLSSNCKEGEIGLFGVNGFCIGTIYSVNTAAKKGNFNVIFFAMKTHTAYCEEPNYSSKKVSMAHDDGFSDASVREKYGGGKYTPKEVVDQMSNCTFIPWQGSCEAQAEAIMNGTTGSSTDSSSSDNDPMSGWDSLCDLLKPLDGLAMMLQRGDTVIVKRIQVPDENMGDASITTKQESAEEETYDDDGNLVEYTSAEYTTTKSFEAKTDIDNQTVEDVSLFAYEGVNIVEDSVTITEYNPEIYNTIKVMWGETYSNEFTLTFNKHKDIFGERLKEMYACNKETVETTDDDDSDEDDGSSSGDN